MAYLKVDRKKSEAAYDYCRHGALARTVLGHNQVQGSDYAYTIQGWLKGVNSLFALPNNITCAEGAAFENLTVTERSQNGAPLVYKARTSIVFEPGFETAAGDSFETLIDRAAVPCDTGGEMPATADMGSDGAGSLVAKDAYGFTLHYFDRDQVHDYIPVGATGSWSTAAPAGFILHRCIMEI